MVDHKDVRVHRLDDLNNIKMNVGIIVCEQQRGVWVLMPSDDDEQQRGVWALMHSDDDEQQRGVWVLMSRDDDDDGLSEKVGERCFLFTFFLGGGVEDLQCIPTYTTRNTILLFL